MTLTLDDVVQWDVPNWSQAVRYWERHAGLHGAPLDCLELGAHHGGLSAWLASMGHCVLCTDLCNTERNARPLIDRYGLARRVAYAEIDATAIPYRDRFDVIAFKSMLGAIGRNGETGRKQSAIRSIYDALKPGGRLLFAENLAGSALHRYFRARWVPWGRTWSYVKIDEIRSLLRAFSRVDVATTGFLAPFGRTETQRRLLSTFDRSPMGSLLPQHWRYIVYGIAVK
jgi:SAM-dependent methyltransferase